MEKAENISFYLPTHSQCRNAVRAWLKKVQNAVLEIEKSSLSDGQKQIAAAVLTKVLAKENGWSQKEYLKFVSSFVKFDFERLDMLEESILICLDSSDENILKELTRISKCVDFYPAVIREYSEETKKYNITSKEIVAIDCFDVLNQIHGSIFSYIRGKARDFIYQTDDFNNLYETIAHISKEGSEDEKNQILEDFDSTFAYVQASCLYQDIYKRWREKFFSSLLSSMHTVYNSRMYYEYRVGISSYYEYKNDSALNRDKKKQSIYQERWKKKRNQV